MSENSGRNFVIAGVSVGIIWILFSLTLLGLSLYAVIYYSGEGSNDPNAKVYVGLGGAYLALIFVVTIINALRPKKTIPIFGVTNYSGKLGSYNFNYNVKKPSVASPKPTNWGWTFGKPTPKQTILEKPTNWGWTFGKPPPKQTMWEKLFA
jgi:hypothetical protein